MLFLFQEEEGKSLYKPAENFRSHQSKVPSATLQQTICVLPGKQGNFFSTSQSFPRDVISFQFHPLALCHGYFSHHISVTFLLVFSLQEGSSLPPLHGALLPSCILAEGSLQPQGNQNLLGDSFSHNISSLTQSKQPHGPDAHLH